MWPSLGSCSRHQPRGKPPRTHATTTRPVWRGLYDPNGAPIGRSRTLLLVVVGFAANLCCSLLSTPTPTTNAKLAPAARDAVSQISSRVHSLRKKKMATTTVTTTATTTAAPTTSHTRPTSPYARSTGAGSATDIASPIDSATSYGGATGTGTTNGTLVEAPVYPHNATFESDQFAVTVSSPHLELTFPNGNDGAIVKLPVFGAKDSIGGTITFNPAMYPSTSNAKLVVSLEGAMYWSEPRPADFLPKSKSGKEHKRRSTRDRDDLSNIATNHPPPMLERKHVFLYSPLSITLSSTTDDESSATGVSGPTPNSALDTILQNRQQALAAVRRRMSYGRAEASRLLEKARRKKSMGTSGANEEPIFGSAGMGSSAQLSGNALGLGVGVDGSNTNLPNTVTSSPEAQTTADPMLAATPWVSKTFMFHSPLQQKDNDGTPLRLPPSVDLKAEAAEHDKGKTKLVEDVRIQYRLVVKYESSLASLTKKVEVPLIFEPGSDPESFYATPQPPIKWKETPMEVDSKPEGMAKLPFRAMLTLPNPPVFARDSESFFFVAFATTPQDKELASIIASNAKISLNITCTYRFDPRRAAAHTSRSYILPREPELLKMRRNTENTDDASEEKSATVTPGGATGLSRVRSIGSNGSKWAATVGAAGSSWMQSAKNGAVAVGGSIGSVGGRAAALAALTTTTGATKEEKLWKWQDPPASPLKRRSHSSRKSTGNANDGVGSGQTTIRRMSGTSTPKPEAGGRPSTSSERENEKPLPVLPPVTPVEEQGGRISTPLPVGGFKDDGAGETTTVLLSTSRTGFPHRPKVKADQSNLPEGLWKGQLNYQWWMIPSLDQAGLSVKYHMEVIVEIDGMVLRTKKEFRIVEPHIVRKEERIHQTKRIELDAFV